MNRCLTRRRGRSRCAVLQSPLSTPRTPSVTGLACLWPPTILSPTTNTARYATSQNEFLNRKLFFQ